MLVAMARISHPGLSSVHSSHVLFVNTGMLFVLATFVPVGRSILEELEDSLLSNAINCQLSFVGLYAPCVYDGMHQKTLFRILRSLMCVECYSIQRLETKVLRWCLSMDLAHFGNTTGTISEVLQRKAIVYGA